MANTPWSATAAEAWSQWLGAVQGLSGQPDQRTTAAALLPTAFDQARNAVEACPGAGSELRTFLETAERNSFGIGALVGACYGALHTCYHSQPDGPQSDSHLSLLLRAGLQGLQLLQEHAKWMAATGRTWAEDIYNVLACFTLDSLPGWFRQADESITPLHLELHSEGMRLARQIVTTVPDTWLEPQRLIQGVASWQEVTHSLSIWRSTQHPGGLSGSPVPTLVQFAHEVLFLPGGEQRWSAGITRRIAGASLLIDCCHFLGFVKECDGGDALQIKVQALHVLSCVDLLPALHELVDEWPSEYFADAHESASAVLGELMRQLRDPLAACQAGRGKGVRAAAGDAAASGLLGQEVGPGLSSALAEQQERREPGPRLHVQQMGQGQQLSLGLLEQFFQDYQSFCRFLANLVGKTPASAEPDQYEHLRARYYQSMLLGCRACVAALQTLSQQPSVPCSACGDRIFAPQDVGSLEQLCCDAYLTQLTVLVQFKLSSARGLVDEAAAVAMGGRPCTAGAVSDSQTGAGPTLPGPLSALCFVLASRLSPRYSTLLESSYQRLCLSPFDWQREVAPCEVMCKGALALLTANLERLEQPELLALLSRDESAALSLSLVRVLDTLGRVASQQWQDALTVEGSIPAGPTVLLASLSQLLERLCVSLVSLQGATFPAGNAAASAAVSPMGNTPGSEEPPAARNPGPEVITRASIFLAASAALHLSRALLSPTLESGRGSSAPSSAISNWRWAISLVALGTSSSVGLAALAARLLLAPIPAILLRLDDKVAADAAAKEDFISHLADLCNAHPLALVPLAASTILEVLARSFYFELGHQSIGLVPQDDGSIQPRQKLLRLVFKACCRTVDEAAGTSFAAQDQQIEGQARQLMEGLLEVKPGDHFRMSVRSAALAGAAHTWQARYTQLLPCMSHAVAKAQGQTSGQPASSASDEPGSAEVPLVALQRDVAVSAAGCCAATRCSSSEVVWAWQRPAYLCAGCRVTRYCRAECARLDWPRHRPICHALAAMRRERPGSCD